MILTVTAPNGRSVDVDTEENPHTCIIDDSFTCIACVAQSLYVARADKKPSEMLTDDKFINRVRQEGVDRCPCGSKYWENDRCIDCGGTEIEETS